MKYYELDIQYHPGKANIVGDALSWKATGKLKTLQMEQRGLLKDMEELKLEVITQGREGLCAAITVEPAILEKNQASANEGS